MSEGDVGDREQTSLKTEWTKSVWPENTEDGEGCKGREEEGPGEKSEEEERLATLEVEEEHDEVTEDKSTRKLEVEAGSAHEELGGGGKGDEKEGTSRVAGRDEGDERDDDVDEGGDVVDKTGVDVSGGIEEEEERSTVRRVARIPTGNDEDEDEEEGAGKDGENENEESIEVEEEDRGEEGGGTEGVGRIADEGGTEREEEITHPRQPQFLPFPLPPRPPPCWGLELGEGRRNWEPPRPRPRPKLLLL